MTQERANIWNDAPKVGEPPKVDVSGFTPRRSPRPAVPPEQVRAVAEAAHFVSREPVRSRHSAAPAREPRLHRTGRSDQIAFKTTTETKDRFYAVADRHKNLPQAYIFERMVAWLEENEALLTSGTAYPAAR
jgi:hypothetical protein